jgi:hypothetical protein
LCTGRPGCGDLSAISGIRLQIQAGVAGMVLFVFGASLVLLALLAYFTADWLPHCVRRRSNLKSKQNSGTSKSESLNPMDFKPREVKYFRVIPRSVRRDSEDHLTAAAPTAVPGAPSAPGRGDNTQAEDADRPKAASDNTAAPAGASGEAPGRGDTGNWPQLSDNKVLGVFSGLVLEEPMNNEQTGASKAKVEDFKPGKDSIDSIAGTQVYRVQWLCCSWRRSARPDPAPGSLLTGADEPWTLVLRKCLWVTSIAALSVGVFVIATLVSDPKSLVFKFHHDVAVVYPRSRLWPGLPPVLYT